MKLNLIINYKINNRINYQNNFQKKFGKINKNKNIIQKYYLYNQ